MVSVFGKGGFVWEMENPSPLFHFSRGETSGGSAEEDSTSDPQSAECPTEPARTARVGFQEDLCGVAASS